MTEQPTLTWKRGSGPTGLVLSEDEFGFRVARNAHDNRWYVWEGDDDLPHVDRFYTLWEAKVYCEQLAAARRAMKG